MKDKKIERKLAAELFDHDCMHAVGLITDKDALEKWRRMEVRHNTKVR